MLGCISGFYGGWVDIVIQRVIEVISLDADHPALAGAGGGDPARPGRRCTVYFIITLIVSLFGWTGLARVVRGRFFALRSEDFVTAARLDGSSERRLIFRHMLPSLDQPHPRGGDAGAADHDRRRDGAVASSASG